MKNNKNGRNKIECFKNCAVEVKVRDIESNFLKQTN